MIYAGRPGLWADWQRFQAKARVARREAEEAAIKRRKKMIDGTIIAVFIVTIIAILGSVFVLLLHTQGKL
jgi:hypothetical protein